ncbi:acetyl-CoA carboxylase biotin carboxyl carrier protein subunit [Corynebacterium sp. HMSC076C10]|uniref:acetyl-CoA carboxylase biotin carboxyl carrier protein subunit n=1 Tax=Corynebacterium sp. HMSC076C10 TaxID=1739361 RepID=UPI0008A663FF|nr:acetyl-CoA carboxylase biotin carboxyl carrier protein subunit [Corynebacterium sp. HMSC076C10]OFJ57930.1 acetyl-CoA carboxylase biotin carboxyl carrier protein subunit [Corynebacterium sp. HMSC076C10]
MVDVCAPFAGVVRWEVAEKDSVTTGQVIAVVEAVKLETPVLAPCPGTVAEVAADQFVDVEGGQLLARITPATHSTTAQHNGNENTSHEGK